MKKADRQKVFDKYEGRCAYCGCELVKGWHVDEIDPVRRTWKYLRDETGRRIWDEEKQDWAKEFFMIHPDRLCIENQNPACASCNINKHSGDLEEFRNLVSGFINSLNTYSVQYKIAKRYELIEETKKEVVFYFEKFNQGLVPERSVATKFNSSTDDGNQNDNQITN